MKKIYLLLVISLTFMACQKEEINTNEEKDSELLSTLDEKEALLILSRENSKNHFKSQIQTYAVPNFENLHYKEITNSDALLTVIPASVPDNAKSQILMLKIKSEIQTVVLSMYPNSQQNADFSGVLIIRSLNGVFMEGYRVEDGRIITKLVKTKSNLKNWVDGDWNDGELGEVYLEGPSGEKDSVPVEYVFIIRTQDVPDKNSDWGFEYSSGGGGGGTTTTTTEEEEEEEEEDKIDDSKLKDCHSKIIDSLKTVNTGIVGKMIQKLAGSHPTDYNWTIDYNMPAGSDPAATAVTSPAAMNSTSSTHINLNRVQNSTDLSMARTFAHEAVHAFLVYQYRYDRNASELNYVQLIKQYAEQNNNNLNDTHHVLYLKENLITPLANALQEVGAKLGYNLPPSFYLDLAYGGLYNSNATNTIFNSLVPEADRERIKSRISAEADNNIVNGVSPAGKKAC